eukprot:TRINITY_DN1144_c0_g1_i5.p2 TRINITY_DN1144_c0_g1~~TRINITY_DN1144_c0_g1_i5.p2  ORF type:complete len:103 (-),score=15.87 TRINITY_DN1144_c0_g1_i5:174-482(-)
MTHTRTPALSPDIYLHAPRIDNEENCIPSIKAGTGTTTTHAIVTAHVHHRRRCRLPLVRRHRDVLTEEKGGSCWPDRYNLADGAGGMAFDATRARRSDGVNP